MDSVSYSEVKLSLSLSINDPNELTNAYRLVSQIYEHQC